MLPRLPPQGQSKWLEGGRAGLSPGAFSSSSRVSGGDTSQGMPKGSALSCCCQEEKVRP